MPFDLIKVSQVFFDLVFIVILDRNNSGFLRGGVRGVPILGFTVVVVSRVSKCKIS